MEFNHSSTRIKSNGWVPQNTVPLSINESCLGSSIACEYELK